MTLDAGCWTLDADDETYGDTVFFPCNFVSKFSFISIRFLLPLCITITILFTFLNATLVSFL